MSAGEGEGGLAKCLCYYISLCSKLAYGGGGGVKNWQNLAYVVYGWSLRFQAVLQELQKDDYVMILRSSSNPEKPTIKSYFVLIPSTENGYFLLSQIGNGLSTKFVNFFGFVKKPRLSKWEGVRKNHAAQTQFSQKFIEIKVWRRI